jgi:hypothetical protein
MFMKLHITILMIFFIISAKAQFAKSPYVTRDPRLDKLVDKQMELNKEALSNRINVEPGFRIMVVNTNNRELALETKGKLLKQYPDQKTYLYYQSPNFIIEFGNFITRKDAELIRKQLSTTFGEKLLIIPAQIEVKGDRKNNQNKQ